MRPGTSIAPSFYIDMRTHGKDFDKYLEEAKKKHGIRFIQCRVPSIDALPGKDDLVIPYVQDGGEQVEEAFDMVILSVGLEVSQEALELAQRLGVEAHGGWVLQNGFFQSLGGLQERRLCVRCVCRVPRISPIGH
jgi:heterodisulfide reductase subunit A2